MKKLLFVFLFMTPLLAFAKYQSVTIYKNDGTTMSGFAKTPDMRDKFIKVKLNKKSTLIKLASAQIDSLVFDIEGEKVVYERQFTPKAYGNKKINSKKSWLKIVERGPVIMYHGFEKSINMSPDINMWFCYKKGERAAYFICNKYAGGMVFTIGAKSAFKKNASFYFKDYPELVSKIKNEYTDRDLKQVVQEYNQWKKNQNKN